MLCCHAFRPDPPDLIFPNSSLSDIQTSRPLDEVWSLCFENTLLFDGIGSWKEFVMTLSRTVPPFSHMFKQGVMEVRELRNTISTLNQRALQIWDRDFGLVDAMLAELSLMGTDLELCIEKFQPSFDYQNALRTFTLAGHGHEVALTGHYSPTGTLERVTLLTECTFPAYLHGNAMSVGPHRLREILDLIVLGFGRAAAIAPAKPRLVLCAG